MGVIRDACLTTGIHPQGPWLSRLRLVISTEQLRSLDFRMPSDTSLVRVRLDGAEILPVTEGALISIGLPVPTPGPGQRLKTIDLDYEVRGRSLPADVVLRPVLPQIALPCLSFCWELAVPPSWRAADEGPGLVAGDATPARNWPLGALGVPRVPWTSRKHATQSPGDVLLRRMDEAMRSAAPDELSFAEWFSRWDSGTTPVIVDRLALLSLGHGPRSRCVPFGQDSGNRDRLPEDPGHSTDLPCFSSTPPW